MRDLSTVLAQLKREARDFDQVLVHSDDLNLLIQVVEHNPTPLRTHFYVEGRVGSEWRHIEVWEESGRSLSYLNTFEEAATLIQEMRTIPDLRWEEYRVVRRIEDVVTQP